MELEQVTFERRGQTRSSVKSISKWCNSWQGFFISGQRNTANKSVCQRFFARLLGAVQRPWKFLDWNRRKFVIKLRRFNRFTRAYRCP